jgi:hypothetical protein
VRGISTVPDVALFLLLVGAAVGTLALAQPPIPADGTADETARLLATTTVPLDDRARSPARGTTLQVLATAALDGATLDGRRLLPSGGSADVDAVERRRSSIDGRVRLVAAWRPYPNATLAGVVEVGPRAPPSIPVDAAVVTVPTGLPDASAARSVAGRAGFEGVAHLLARGVVSRAFPTEVTRMALYDPRTRDETIERYRRVASAVDLDETDGRAVDGRERTTLQTALENANATAANGLLADALAARIETDLRRRFASAGAAARALDADRVTVTVRTWSARRSS